MSNAAKEIVARKVIPKKLDEDLRAIPKFGVNLAREMAKKDDMLERAMFDEVFGDISASKKNSFPILNKPSTADRTPNAENFESSILSRLKTLEVEAKSLRQQLSKQVATNLRLEQENTDLNVIKNDHRAILEECAGLRKQCSDQREELTEMHAFLKDYGLHWVGHNQTAEEPDESVDGEDGMLRTIEESKIEYDTLSGKIQILNNFVLAEPSQVITEEAYGAGCGGGRRARLVHAGEYAVTIKVIFYRDGLFVKRGPLKPYGSQSYNAFKQDILDGYFPGEFKEESANGDIIIDFIDQHAVTCHCFNDAGGINVHGLSNGDGAGDLSTRQPMSKTELLNKLPGQKISPSGEVMDMGKAIGALLSDPKSGNGTASGKEDKGSKPSSQPVVINTLSDSKGSDPTSTLRIRWIDGTQVQLVMSGDDTIGTVVRTLQDHFYSETDEGPPLELRSTYPVRVLAAAETLSEGGYVPNGTIHVKKVTA